MSVMRRISEAVRSASPNAMDAAPLGPRCPTPLRPNASLLERVPLPPAAAQLRSTESPFSTTGPPRTNVKGGGRGDRFGATLVATPSSLGGSAGGGGGKRSTAAAAGIGEEGAIPTTVGLSDDTYSVHEKQIVSEVNLMRGDPRGYAAIVERDVIITRPYVPMEMTYRSLVTYVADLEQRQQRAAEQLDDLANAKKREVHDLYAVWVAEDVDRAKKAKKPAPNKKGGGTPEPEMDADRGEILSQLERKFTTLQRELIKELETTTAAAQAGNQGLKHVRDAMHKLSQCPVSLAPLVYNRGLSLAAREVCTTSSADDPASRGSVRSMATSFIASSPPSRPQTVPTHFGSTMLQQQQQLQRQQAPTTARPVVIPTTNVEEVRQIATKFGEIGSRVAIAQHTGVVSIRQSVIEMLMGIQEPQKRGSRNALLDPAMRSIGCGWRKRNKESLTTLLLSSNFEELDAIYSRPYLPLDEVRKLLPLATKSVNATTIVKLQTSLDIELITPVSHPVTCGNTSTVLMRCERSIEIVACLGADGDATPSAPAAGTGDVFIQRVASTGGESEDVAAAVASDDSDRSRKIIEIRVALPSKSHFKLHLFARKLPTSTLAMSAAAAAAASTNDMSMGFAYIGLIRLLSAKWHSSNILPPFPTVTADFTLRQCTLISPLEGYLRPDQLVTFEVVIPKSDYLQPELQRLTQTLDDTRRRLGATLPQPPPSTSSIGDLEVHAAESSPDEQPQCHQPIPGDEEEIAACRGLAQELRQKRDTEVPTLMTEIANQQRDLGKKKGKELEKSRATIVEMEEAIKHLEAAAANAEARVVELEEKMVARRRAERRAAAQLQRFEREEQKLRDAADRQQPLHVQVSLEERRANLAPVDADFTVYRLTTRVPKGPGPVTLFINGLAAVMYNVCE